MPRTRFRKLDEETRAKLRTLPSNDEVFAETIRNRAWCLASPASLSRTRRSSRRLPQTGFAKRGADPAPFLVTFAGLLRNIPVLEDAAAGRGLLDHQAPSATASCAGCRW